MSYQVLARKWRPSRFVEMVGQEHVLKALVNALDEDRLHHAYLFTGTRGVGKTSIARLFAKALNCENGVSSDPCGQCSPCVEIAEGRFVDLIEVDAASRTKVEDTRELLDNVQYAPTQGRYKVYLIDEVHMLSGHSFNALLKTLEEPPPHIKFLLATTDPQKLPLTILSRCLQFNLKNLAPERIVDHLSFVLGEESVPFEDPALWLLARSAEGSLRDALSLTDQSIAFGAGSVTETDVRTMLGTIDHRMVFDLLRMLVAQDGKQMMEHVQRMSEFTPDYGGVLSEMISILHRLALAQVVPEAIDNSLGDQQQILELASKMRAETVQLYYQIALHGRRDLPLAPLPREGLEMTLLRMLAFRPVDQRPIDTPSSVSLAKPKAQPVSEVPPWDDIPAEYAEEDPSKKFESDSEARSASSTLTESDTNLTELPIENLSGAVEPKEQPVALTTPKHSTNLAAPQNLMELRVEHWVYLVEQLNLSGMTESLARSLSLEKLRGNLLVFHYTSEQEGLLNSTHRQRIVDAVNNYFAEPVSLEFNLGEQANETPIAFRIRRDAERKAAALLHLKQDPVVLQLIETFGAEIDESSVEAINID